MDCAYNVKIVWLTPPPQEVSLYPSSGCRLGFPSFLAIVLNVLTMYVRAMAGILKRHSTMCAVINLIYTYKYIYIYTHTHIWEFYVYSMIKHMYFTLKCL